MCELLEFICSVIENGNSADNAILSILPNLFGPGEYESLVCMRSQYVMLQVFCDPTITQWICCDVVFGVKNHAVSCKLLEYGYLAVCSRHRLVFI